MARNNFEGVENPKVDLEYSKTGSKHEDQFAHANDGDPSGGNISGGKVQKQPVHLYVVPFQGKSGQPDNQSTFRGKGST